MVSLSATDANSEKKGEVFITLYRGVNYKQNGMSAGRPKDIKKGVRFWLPPLSSAFVYPCEQSIFFTNHFPDLREDKC